MPRSLLIIDDDRRIRASLPGAIQSEVDEVHTAESADAALTVLENSPIDIVLSDVRMPGMDGIELLTELGKRYPQLPVILMTAFDDLPTITTAMKQGAIDFLVKPLELNQLRKVLKRVFEDMEASSGLAMRDRASEDPDPNFEMLGRDVRMVEIFKMIGRVSSSRTNVVIRGESGTGKELVARAIHDASAYASEPFVAVNCTALPSSLLESELFGHVKGSFTGALGNRQGRFAVAGRGTVFLDEIGDTSIDFQAKLLRVLQEHEFYPVGAEYPERANARVIAATHRDLEQLVAEGGFREDLYYRLRVVEIVVPPLRERSADIPLLAEALIAKVCREAGREVPAISEEAMSVMLNYRWPGNVRELENALARAVVLAPGSVMRPEHLDVGLQDVNDQDMASLETMEREHISRILDSTGGQKGKAAEILGISRPRLDRLIAKHELTDFVRNRTLGSR